MPSVKTCLLITAALGCGVGIAAGCKTVRTPLTNVAGLAPAAPPRWDTGELIATPSVQTYVYAWLDDQAAANDPAALVATLTQTVAAQNQSEVRFPPSLPVGYGVYAAADPLSTVAWGNHLVVLPVQPFSDLVYTNGSFAKTSGASQQDLMAFIHSDKPMLIYPTSTSSYAFTKEGQNISDGVIVRSDALLDRDQVRILAPIIDRSQCPRDSLPSLPDVTKLLDALGDAVASGFVPCVGPWIGESSFNYYDNGALDSDRLLGLAVNVEPDAFKKAGGVDGNGTDRVEVAYLLSQIKGRLTDFKKAKVNSLPVDARELKAARSLNLIDSAAQPASSNDLDSAIVAHLQAKNPQFIAAIKEQYRFYGQLMARVSERGLAVWAPKVKATAPTGKADSSAP